MLDFLYSVVSHPFFPIALIPIVFVFASNWDLSATRKVEVKGEREEFELTRIMVHPIKSCRGTEVQESEYTASGLKYDRQWMIVDRETHKFVTAREIPQIVLISPAVNTSTGTLDITIPGHSTISIPLEPTASELEKWELISDVTLWSKTLDAYIVPNQTLTSALSSHTGRSVCLVMKGPTPRPLDMQPDQSLYPIPAPLPEEAQTAFADGYPFLLVSDWSVSEVEDKVRRSAEGKEGWAVKPRLEGEMREKWESGEGEVLRRTRGNLVVGGKGGKAWAEDTWGVVKVGGEEMCVVSMCGRCQLPNVDPSTGVSHPSIPYKVLSKFRRVDPVDKFSPCFGVNVAPMASSGTVRVGDKVTVVSKNKWVKREE